MTHTPAPWRWRPRHMSGSGRSDIVSGAIVDTGTDAPGAIIAILPQNPPRTQLQVLVDARLITAAPEMREALDPDTLEAIADEIESFEHSARAAGLRSLAKRQRAALAKAGGHDHA